MTKNQLEALKIFGEYTGGHFTFFRLIGPAYAGCRAHILSTLKGEKVPKAKAGINALEKAIYELANPHGLCPATKEKNFAEWAAAQIKKQGELE